LLELETQSTGTYRIFSGTTRNGATTTLKQKKNNYNGENGYVAEMAQDKPISSKRTIDLYFKQKHHNQFNEWFEEFLEITTISSFNKDKGVDFYSFPNNNTIMVYTLEKLLDNEEYISDKLGITTCLRNVNNSENRSYYERYKEVKERIVYKKEYLDSLLNTEIMRLFYSDSDIEQFFSKYRTL
jgi:hypothetical protein